MSKELLLHAYYARAPTATARTTVGSRIRDRASRNDVAGDVAAANHGQVGRQQDMRYRNGCSSCRVCVSKHTGGGDGERGTHLLVRLADNTANSSKGAAPKLFEHLIAVHLVAYSTPLPKAVLCRVPADDELLQAGGVGLWLAHTVVGHAGQRRCSPQPAKGVAAPDAAKLAATRRFRCESTQVTCSTAHRV